MNSGARKLFNVLACRTASWFASPTALLMIPAACVVWILLGASVDVLTLVLSVLAISMTQLVLVSQATGEKAMQHKLDELVVAVPDADSSVAGEERRD